MSKYLKAVVGAIIAFLSSLSTALIDGSSFADVTAGQWVVSAIAFLTALGVIWAVPNTPADG